MDRGIALSKLIKFITLTVACDGYLNFMGNEFGHPEWIDFPREGNDWSFSHARRQWNLADNGFLKYQLLGNFDKAMISLVKKEKVLSDRKAKVIKVDHEKKIIVFRRGELVFVFNFSEESLPDYELSDLPLGYWKVRLNTDSEEFGGFGRISETVTYETNDKGSFKIYLPTYTALVLEQA
jgi:1,4-alpha-glucan branching enzyme